jgi:DNA-binding LytR/AlgR family response regulator
MTEPGLHCLVVDDGAADLEHLRGILHAQPTVAGVTTARTARDALDALRTKHFDVAFIEIALADLDGIELAWALKRLTGAPEIVFVTRHPDRAAEAYDLGAVDYVTKPSRRERLVEAVRRVRRTRPAGPAGPVSSAGRASSAGPLSPAVADDEVIPVSVRGSTKLVRRSAVRWAQAKGDYVRLYTADGSYLIRAGIAALADSWHPAGLVRIHRSYLVAPRYVTGVQEIGPGQFLVDVGGRQLPVSRRQAAKLKGWLAARAPRPGTLAA